MQEITHFLLDHWALALAALSFFTMAIMLESGQSGALTGQISPQKAIALINRDDAFVLDVRDHDLYVQGHIVGAHHMSAQALLSAQTLPKALKKHVSKPMVVACVSGVSSMKVVKVLQKLGAKQAHSLEGGMQAWRKQSLPVVIDA